MLSLGTRWQYAFRAFFSLIVHGRLAEEIAAAARDTTAPPDSEPVAAAAAAVGESADHSGDRAVQLLALLQRDGRLIDFLMEDVSAFPDAQVGAAAKDVHAGCRASISRYLTLAAVLDQDEGGTVIVEPNLDPSRIRLLGNVAATPPLRGLVRHRGWEATRLELPPLPAIGRAIVAPAEVEVE